MAELHANISPRSAPLEACGTVSDEAEQLQTLARRMSVVHLRQRLGIESEGGQHVFGYGRNFFHPENWFSMHSLLRKGLRLLLLEERGRRNTLAVRLMHNRVQLAGLPESFAGFRILHLSDLHLDVSAAFVQRLVERVSTLEYDLCVITGDFRFRTHGSYAAALAGMAQLMPQLSGPVYGVLGNHDCIRMVPGLEAMGIKMLLNESVVVRRGEDELHLAGVDDPHYYRVDNLERACGDIAPGALAVLLSHSPEIYKQVAHTGVSLMLCGHTHGGQIRLPGGIPLMTNAQCPRRFCGGPWRHCRLQGYTSLGTGSSIIAARFNCPPEMTIHHLQAAPS